jgi:hypothetical protein
MNTFFDTAPIGLASWLRAIAFALVETDKGAVATVPEMKAEVLSGPGPSAGRSIPRTLLTDPSRGNAGETRD